MEIISVSNARIELFNLIKEVNESHVPVNIVNKCGNSAVLVSADDWSAIEETLYLSSVPKLVENIKAGMNEPIEDMTNADEVEW